MALPKQVQRQVEEAELIEQQLAGTLPQEDTPDPPPADPPPAEPPVAAAPEPTPPAEPVDDGWQKRYETLQGKYNAEVTRLHEANKATSAQLQALMQQLTQLQQHRPPEPPKAPEKPLVTGQDDEKFGSDLIDAMRRVSREEGRALEKRLQAMEELVRSVAPQVQRVERVETQVAQALEDRFWSEIMTEVPDWEAINADQRWLSWLTEYDPVAGTTRQGALEAAQKALDHRRVAGLFKLFKATFKPAGNQVKTELARQVAPAKSSKTTVQPQGVKVYTGQEYNYWLDPRRIHDTDNARLQAMIAEIERAFAENRIQW